MADPELDFNPATGKHRLRLVNGDLVETDEPFYEMLSMWTERPGWMMEETPRRGSLSDEFPETTSQTPSRLKASLEERCDPLREERVIDEVVCESVTQPAERFLAFSVRYRRPGKPGQKAQLEIGT